MEPHPLRSLLLRAALRLALLGCAALLFAAGIWWDNAANRGIEGRTTPAIPYSLAAGVPQGGINTYNLHAEADPAKVRRTFELIAAAGLHWVRVQFPWEDIEVCGKNQFTDCRAGSQGQSTWTKYDYIVEQATANGLELIVRLDTPPDWARQQAINTPELQAAKAAGRFPLTGPPDNFSDYGDFVAAVAQRYKGTVRFFQIWNEPNLPGEWNYRTQNPAELVELLRIARERIKTINPQAVIVFPALSPTDGRGDGVNDLDYLQEVYNAGGRELFDIMSAQLYGLGQPPTEHRYIRPNISLDRIKESLLQPIDTKADIGRVVLIREIMVRNGDANKAVWVSELGWNSAPETVPPERRYTWGAPVGEETKGQYLVQTLERARREWPWMGALNIWMFRYGGMPAPPDDPTPYFQLVDFNFNPLPAYAAVKSYVASAANTQVDPAQRSFVPVAATVVSGALVLVASVWLLPALGAVFALMVQRARRPALLTRLSSARFVRSDALMLAALGGALLIFYVGSPQLPITALGALLFGACAMLRPDLALLFVPLTVPLYLAPKGVWDQRFGLSRPAGYFIPLHEFVLLVAALATALRTKIAVFRTRRDRRFKVQLWSAVSSARPLTFGLRPTPAWWPMMLFVAAGTLGVGIAVARGAALREWRWLIVEPLLFGALLWFWARDEYRRWQFVWAWLGAGIAVATVGLLQLAGLDLTALLPQSNCFSDRVVIAEGGLGRITSVYCHPNNLGLALGRVWPVLAALALHRRWTIHNGRRFPVVRAWLLVATLIVLAALAASFSKGAFLGAFVALLVLGWLLRHHGQRFGTLLLALAVLGAAGGLLLGLVFGIERLNPLGGSSGARVELWTSALAMLRDHPLTGVGLDQFYQYRTDAAFGNRYIDPAARNTNEQYASHPHNLVLDLLIRTGPLGLIALIWLVLRFFGRCRHLLKRNDQHQALVIGLIASMSAALTHGLVDNFYFVPDLAFSFWLMLSIVALLATGQSAHSGTTTEDANGRPVHVQLPSTATATLRQPHAR